MKKIISIVLIVVCLLSLFTACGNKVTTTETQPTSTPSESVSSEENTELPVAEQDMKYQYGVYNILYAETGEAVYLDNTNKLILNTENKSTLKDRFTLHIKERVVDGVRTKYYAIYIGDDEVNGIGVSTMIPSSAKLLVDHVGYNPTDKQLWTVEDCGDGTCMLVPKCSLPKKPMCLAIKDGQLVAADRDENDRSQRFKIEKAEAHPSYYEYVSKNGEAVVRVSKDTVTKSTGVTHEYMQDYADFFEEAIRKEVELTGFRPYDIFVISGWEDIALAAGVGDNYNVITAGEDFMKTEMSRMAYNRDKNNIMDLSFGMLHELGHMFDSQRGWNFESEAWTDLKLCYVIDKMTKDHAETDGLIFGCSPQDYPKGRVFTYEGMAECLDIHKNKGAMETVYGFYGAARLFLLMAYDFGWDPFIETFHWYQDNGYTQNSFERYERFTIFVDKLSEFSGKDIKNDYLNENNWKVFEEYYTGKTTEAV